MLQATCYTLDVGERAGCIFIYCACFAVIGFVGFVGLSVLKRARMQSFEQSLGNNSYLIGKYYLAMWRDQLDCSRFINHKSSRDITNDSGDNEQHNNRASRFVCALSTAKNKRQITNIKTLHSSKSKSISHQHCPK